MSISINHRDFSGDPRGFGDDSFRAPNDSSLSANVPWIPTQTTMIYGATPVAWCQWDMELGLTADLLPCVCEQGLPIASSSALTDYGKVPSQLVGGTVVGFPGWTSHITTGDEIDRWMKDPRLGICLQTKVVRAIDVDVTETASAQVIYDLVMDWCEAHTIEYFPRRTRSNSSKFLLLFHLTGEFGKRVIPVQGGMVEWLMTGQQCVVTGTHPTGVQYEWDGGLPTAIPVLTVDQFNSLFAAVSTLATGPIHVGRVRRVSDVDAPTDVTDEVGQYLIEKQLVTGHGAGGRLDVTCPWASDHTAGATGGTSTSYFPAGTGGYETAAFICLHGHCAGRTIGAFLDAIGFSLEGFDEIPVGDPLDLHGTLMHTNGVNHALPSTLLRTKTGTIRPRLNNVLDWLRWRQTLGSGVSFDLFTDEILLHQSGGYRPFIESDYTGIQSLAERGNWPELTSGELGFDAIHPSMIRQAVHKVAHETCIDSAKDWIHALPDWDGRPRITTFCSHYLGAEQTPYTVSVAQYLWSAMAGRIIVPGSQTDMVPILISGQGTGKSSAVRALSPSLTTYGEISLDDSDADRARLTRGKTLIELSELKGLHTKEMEGVKAFVSRREDSWVPKYCEMRTIYKRRFVMIGTTNQEAILGDATGARRWLPMRVGRQDIQGILTDHAQLWAEAKVLYHEHGIMWQDAHTLALDEHGEFEIEDSWESNIRDWLSEIRLTNMTHMDSPYLRMADVLVGALKIEARSAKRADIYRVGDILRKIGYNRKVMRIEGVCAKVWMAPSKAVENAEV